MFAYAILDARFSSEARFYCARDRTCVHAGGTGDSAPGGLFRRARLARGFFRHVGLRLLGLCGPGLSRGLTRSAPRRRAAPATPSDLGHMVPIDADLLATLSSGGAGLVGGELVGLSFLMCRASAFPRDFALTMRIHGGKSAIFGPRSGRMGHAMMGMMLLLGFHDQSDSLRASRSDGHGSSGN